MRHRVFTIQVLIAKFHVLTIVKEGYLRGKQLTPFSRLQSFFFELYMLSTTSTINACIIPNSHSHKNYTKKRQWRWEYPTEYYMQKFHLPSISIPKALPHTPLPLQKNTWQNYLVFSHNTNLLKYPSKHLNSSVIWKWLIKGYAFLKNTFWCILRPTDYYRCTGVVSTTIQTHPSICLSSASCSKQWTHTDNGYLPFLQMGQHWSGS